MKKRYIELHLHLDGAITPDIAKDLAALQKIKLPYKDERELEKALMVSKDCRSLNEFLECFKLPCSLLQTKEGIESCLFGSGKHKKTRCSICGNKICTTTSYG